MAACEITQPSCEIYAPDEEVTVPEEYGSGLKNTSARKNGLSRVTALILAAAVLCVSGAVLQDETVDESVQAPAESIQPQVQEQLEEDIYAGISDAQLLVSFSPWQGEGISVCFVQGGGGWWQKGREYGILRWSERTDGSVAYSGHAMPANVDFSGTDSSNDIDSDEIFFLNYREVSGTAKPERGELSLSIDNPLGSTCMSYAPGSGGAQSEILEWLNRSDEEVIGFGDWRIPEEKIYGGAQITGIYPREDGSFEVEINGASPVSCSCIPSESRGDGWYALVTEENGIPGTEGSQFTVTFADGMKTSVNNGLSFAIIYLDGKPCIAFFDPFRTDGFSLSVMELASSENS